MQAAPKFNYGAICAIYLLSSIGLGGNIPIDATIALEYLPQNRRNLVALLSIWQPIGVVAASAIAWGTAAKYRCDPKLPSCHAVASSEACCTVSSNMGWRYELIILGCITLLIFFARFFIFPFYESPKFLLSVGKEAEAIEVLRKIAKFNRAPGPTLTLKDFAAIENTASPVSAEGPQGEFDRAQATKKALKSAARGISNLKSLFTNKLHTFIFVLLAIAYMVCQSL
jgi:MFS family permease